MAVGQRPRAAAAEGTTFTALAAGAAGSVALTLYAGLRIGAPRVLLFLFALWVVFPFVVLAGGYLFARLRSAPTRLALARAILAASLGSLLAYAAAALAFTRPPTPVFVLVAPLSLLLAGGYVVLAVLTASKRP